MSELEDRLNAQERKFAHESFRRLAEADAKIITDRLIDKGKNAPAIRIMIRIAIVFFLVGVASFVCWFLER